MVGTYGHVCSGRGEPGDGHATTTTQDSLNMMTVARDAVIYSNLQADYLSILPTVLKSFLSKMACSMHDIVTTTHDIGGIKVPPCQQDFVLE